MREFRQDKVIRRRVRIKASDRAIADANWVLELSFNGVSMHRLGRRGEAEYHLSWRSVISHALIHGAGRRKATVRLPDAPPGG